MQRFFFNDLGQLRSGWRVLVFIAAYMFGVTITEFKISAAVTIIWPDLLLGSRAPLIINSVILLIPAILIGYLCARSLEGLPFRSLGAWFTSGWFRHFLFGILIGGVTLLIAALPGIVSGRLTFSFSRDSAESTFAMALASAFLLFAMAAAFEEAFFRGYIFQTLVRADLVWIAIGITALFFAAVHLVNPNAGIFSTVNTAIAGVWFGLAYLKTRDLWFVWGLHLMWNFAQGSLLGIEVSGLADIGKPSLLTESDQGPAWLTGESYGLEASVACTVALAISIFFIQKMSWLRPDEELLAMTSPKITQH